MLLYKTLHCSLPEVIGSYSELWNTELEILQEKTFITTMHSFVV